MIELTDNQQFVISTLISRGACFTAHSFEVAWKQGKTQYIDARNGARKGLVRAIDKGNSEALQAKSNLKQIESIDRLTAAAPELLEMVQLFVAEVEFKAMVSGSEGHFSAVTDKARALIEKVTGEPYVSQR